MDENNFLQSFGRRKGHKISPYRRVLVDNLLPKLTISSIDTPANLEIGFGQGEHIAMMAQKYPDEIFIGAEPYLNGVANLLTIIDKKDIKNIRLFPDDARFLLNNSKEKILDKIYILFPDPWPKNKQKKRRIINQDLLKLLSKMQKPKGKLLIATDHKDYAKWILNEISQSPNYKLIKQAYDTPDDWVETKYHHKTSRQGRPALFIHCENTSS